MPGVLGALTMRRTSSTLSTSVDDRLPQVDKDVPIERNVADEVPLGKRSQMRYEFTLSCSGVTLMKLLPGAQDQ